MTRRGAGEAERDEVGASAVEYGLLVAAIAALVVLVIFAFGGVVNNLFTHSCDEFESKVSVSTSCS